MSGYVVGPDAAVADLASAGRSGSCGPGPGVPREERSASRATPSRWTQLEALELPRRAGTADLRQEARPADPARPADASAAARRRRPGGRDRSSTASRTTRTPTPTEYAVLLPPEYHPLRSYPAVVALHGGNGPRGGDRLVGGRGARRGLHRDRPRVQPARPAEGLPLHRPASTPPSSWPCATPGSATRSTATASSSAASCSAGTWPGTSAWPIPTCSPGSPSSRACPSSTSPIPAARRAAAALRGARRPGPGVERVVFGEVLKPLILKAYDVTYVEYYRRGLEDFPEEAPHVFDWMDRRRRDPYPKSFDASRPASRTTGSTAWSSASSCPAGRPPPRPSTRSARTSTRRRSR